MNHWTFGQERLHLSQLVGVEVVIAWTIINVAFFWTCGSDTLAFSFGTSMVLVA